MQYLLVNTGTGATSAPSVDWASLADAGQLVGAVRTPDGWLVTLLKALDEDDLEQLAERTGLRIQL